MDTNYFDFESIASQDWFTKVKGLLAPKVPHARTASCEIVVARGLGGRLFGW